MKMQLITRAVGAPFIWNAQTSALATLTADSGWVVTQPLQINDAGQILAKAKHDTSSTNSYVLLDPRP